MHSSQRRQLIAAVVTAPLLAAATSPAEADDWDDDEPGTPVVPLKDARLKIEFNATDRDVGVQLFLTRSGYPANHAPGKFPHSSTLVQAAG